MPLLGQNPNGSWMPQYGAGNWVGSWGQRPADFGPGQNAYSYFQQNPMQMENYNSGGLGRAFTNWFGGNQQGGPTGGNPRYPQTPRPPMQNPYAGAIGNAGGNIGGEYVNPDVPNIYNPKPNTYGTAMLGSSMPQPQLPNAGGTQPPQMQIGGMLQQRPQTGLQGGLGGFRNGGWF